MKLIADSGSTKTSWYLLTGTPELDRCCETAGINPFFQRKSEILSALESDFTLPKQAITSLSFYGAGATTNEKKMELCNALRQFFAIRDISIDSDLLGAARALCGRSQGIAAILGTGSNSCYYDGQRIALYVSPLGYVLGDEGSGAILGRKLLADILKNQLPEHLIKVFFETYQTTPAEIMENVYRKPFPNRYMAGFTKFLSENIQYEELRQIVFVSFCEFFNRNIAQLPQAATLPVNVAGSIAWYFSSILHSAAQHCGFAIGKVIRQPLDGLVEYHKGVI